jgi:hypothetical protein
MSSAAAPSRREVFEPLVVLAQARTVALVEAGSLARDDGEFLLRALFDLETDGADCFDGALPADGLFYEAVAAYLAARAGPAGVEEVLAPASAEALARLAAAEGGRVAHLLGLPGPAACGPRLDRAVTALVTNQGGSR